MARLAITALLATGTALVPPTTRIAQHKLRAVDEATALLEQAAALRAEADALAAEAMPPAPAPPPPAPVAVAEPVVEAKELTPEEKTQREIENRKKITEALRAATKSRNKEQIQIALATAEKAGGFSRDNLDIIAAVQAFNELNELSDEVRNKLVADMRKSDPMSADYQGGGNLYLGIFGLMTVLVIALSARGDDGVIAGAGGASRKRAGGAGAGAAPPAELADARPAKHSRPTELG